MRWESVRIYSRLMVSAETAIINLWWDFRKRGRPTASRWLRFTAWTGARVAMKLSMYREIGSLAGSLFLSSKKPPVEETRVELAAELVGKRVSEFQRTQFILDQPSSAFVIQMVQVGIGDWVSRFESAGFDEFVLEHVSQRIYKAR